ncbi:MAG: hypothetical protein ABFS18_10240 [Thermodesulfobacteriota bacterium]
MRVIRVKGCSFACSAIGKVVKKLSDIKEFKNGQTLSINIPFQLKKSNGDVFPFYQDLKNNKTEPEIILSVPLCCLRYLELIAAVNLTLCPGSG